MQRFGFKIGGPWLEHTGAAERLLEGEGFSWIEVGAWEAQNDALLRYLDGLRARWTPAVSVHCEFVDINIASLVPEVRETAVQVIRRNLKFAESVGAQRAVIHGGDIAWFDFFPEDHPEYPGLQDEIMERRENALEVLAGSCQTLLGEAEDRDIELVIENMYFPWEMLNTPSEMAALLHDRLDGKLGMVLDFGHSLISGGGPAAYINALGKTIRHTHLHDNDGVYDLHLPVGQGRMPLSPALSQLVSLNPDITFLLELPLRQLEDFVEGRRRILAEIDKL